MRKEGDTTIIEESDFEPITKEEFKSIIEPVMDAILSLTKVTMELSAAGKEVEDEEFRLASTRAFSEIGRTIYIMKHVREMMETLDMVPPEEDLTDE
ncbi:hypothetical protein KUT41_18430 [Pseudomonas aeruginosa]|uniref:hypothetical protein n=1 Tax=Pseudomonas aeruginosa TaxID=287 RepID=UPI0003D37828|nr:hypothetical protein [Pseudomonas aeruginosa]ETD45946.1 hypothetical protein X778_30295 [Pseudomonas aeruginosa VRFPA07]KSH37043.1 hypothetical protein AO963_03720 [Pseudomonas aeruginosa]MBG6485632.1 hypothetical protein [Pseudomonas aeruginosa]MBV5636993.1 hypothetical protein [Pseudomonas aeruginosa]MBV5964863.1 hypothetical protein [Pseudomonas aeruginosa]